MAGTRPKKLLEGVKIADFTKVIVGPLTTKTLSDYGAQVIRIEGKANLDTFRTSGPEPDLSPQFTQWSTGKMGVTLNLADPRGKEIARKIVAWADVAVENFAGGAMERMGLGYEELKKVNPEIIMLSSCMQGQTGPFSRHPGWGFQLSALSGFNHITGWPDRQVPEMGVYTDFITPNYNVIAILSALLYKKRTGKGQYIDAAQFETGVHFMAPLILDYRVNGRIATRTGNRSDRSAPHGAYRCRDLERHCLLAVSTDEQWQGLCRVIGRPDLADDPRFAAPGAREANRAELDEIIKEWALERFIDDIMLVLRPVGVTAEHCTADAVPDRDRLGPYRCLPEDRWCAISVYTDAEWNALCRVMGDPEMASDPRFRTLLVRKENEDELDRRVEEWTSTRTAEEVQDGLQRNGVPAGIVESGEDQLDKDPQTRHRNFFPEIIHPRMGSHHAAASPFKLSKTECELKSAPMLGEHNEYVLKDILGMSDEEVVQLVVDGVLE